MNYFNFDYTIEDFRVRLANVIKYLEDNEDDVGYMSSEYIDRLGSYILFAYDKEFKNEKEHITEGQYRVLIDNENGLLTHVNNIRRQSNQNKKNKVERTEENLKRLYKNIETLFIADDNIKEYEKLTSILKENDIHGKNKSINEDIYEAKKAFVTSEVKSRNDVKMSYETLKNLDVEYNLETLKILLRYIYDLGNKEPYSDAHCIYLDLTEAIKKCKFTDVQRESLIDYMNGISTQYINMVNVELAIKKILKNLN